MIEHLPQALSSLSLALKIGKSLVDIRDSTKLQEAVIKFNSSIIDAQSEIMASQNVQSALSQRVSELEQECMRLKNWEAERNSYTRREISPGVFAYVENTCMGELESAHKYCCNCFDNYHKSTLQQFNIEIGRKIGLSCHRGCPDLVFRHYL